MYNMGDSGRKWVKMLTGQFERSIDSKNRVVLPSNIKNQLGNIFYLSLSFVGKKRMEIRPSEEFQALLDKIDLHDQLDPSIQKLKRYIMSNTIQVETDKLGRFLIPENFIKSIAVKTTVSFVGMGKIVEIWSTEDLQIEQKEFEEDGALENLVSDLRNKGIKL